jgi:hypothetical protein
MEYSACTAARRAAERRVAPGLGLRNSVLL